MGRSTLKTYLLLTIPFFVCRLLDIISTEMVFSLGGFEANPVAAYLMFTIGKYNSYIFAMFVMALIGGLTLQIWRHCMKIGSHFKSMRGAKVAFVVIYVGLICQNMVPFISNMNLYNCILAM